MIKKNFRLRCKIFSEIWYFTTDCLNIMLYNRNFFSQQKKATWNQGLSYLVLSLVTIYGFAFFASVWDGYFSDSIVTDKWEQRKNMKSSQEASVARLGFSNRLCCGCTVNHNFTRASKELHNDQHVNIWCNLVNQGL